jgi:hypothetical protein
MGIEWNRCDIQGGQPYPRQVPVEDALHGLDEAICEPAGELVRRDEMIESVLNFASLASEGSGTQPFGGHHTRSGARGVAA